jgi:hypothetical protein
MAVIDIILVFKEIRQKTFRIRTQCNYNLSSVGSDFMIVMGSQSRAKRTTMMPILFL